MMCWSRARRNLEESFPHHNMVLVLLFQLLAISAYAILTPSLYKFITTPKTRPDELNCAEELRVEFHMLRIQVTGAARRVLET
ncbi:hypothetical protein GBAR_LOCUS11454, partial [Geodia barretti]